MRGIHHVRAGAGGAGARRRDIDGNRYRRGDDGADNTAHSKVKAAWRVQLYDDDIRPVITCRIKTAFNVIRDCGADGVIDGEQDCLVTRLSVE